MKNLNLVFRRTHLYLGMLLIPWVFIYAFSTFIFNHGSYFRTFRGEPSDWVKKWEKEYEVDLPQGQQNLRKLGNEILQEHGISNMRYGVRRTGQRLDINVQKFLTPERLVYLGEERKLVAETREFFWAEMFLRLHIRHGWAPQGFLQGLWSLAIDVVCFSILIWMITGIYLWWKIPSTRKWGFLALGSGFLSFLGLLWTL